MKALAFAASNSRQSINKQLVTHAAEILRAEIAPSVEVQILDLNDYEMPIYSIDRERETGIPPAAQRFLDAIGKADVLLVSFAEHNGSYSAAYKNVFDWASRIEKAVFQGKPMMAMATSPGGRGGANVLELVQRSVSRFGADLRATLSVPRFAESFDIEAKALVKAEHQAALREGLSALAAPESND